MKKGVMKHKKILLIVFFLTLFVFQQVKASGIIPPTENPPQINLAPANVAFDHIGVWVLHLVDPTGEVATPRIACWTIGPGDYAFGCGSGDPLDTQNPHNPIYIDVDQYYLPDVLPREMNVNELYPTSGALKAQAVAARALATWKAIYQYDGQPGYINNSTRYQVYIPGSYSTYTNPQDPVGVQQMISTAISSTSGQYLSYNGEAIDAEFGSDMQDRTQTEHLNPGDPPVDPFVPKAYLTGVEDPISTASCFNNSSGGHDYGMSQRGAIRWSLGNECPTGTGAVWPITWTDYRQILVHYYTGIDILDGNDNHVAPDDRWNLLWHNNFNSPVGTPPTLTSGQPASLQIRLQNTSTTAWNANNMEIGYHWGDNNWQIASVSQLFSDIPAGKEFPDITAQPLTVSNIIAPPNGGTYTLHLDLRRSGGAWFSSAGWPDATIDIHVDGPTATPTFTPEPPTATPTGTSALAVSTFDNDGEGWTVVNDAYPPIYHADGGNPGGYLSAKDKQHGSYWYWRAPEKFHGDFSMAYGKTLTFDLKQSSTTSQANRDDIILTGGGVSLIFNTSYNPGTDWTPYSVMLDETAGWVNSSTGQAATQAEIQAVLAALTDLQIRGEYRVGSDTGSLDNVMLGVEPDPNPPPTVTPQPTSCVRICFWESCSSANQPAIVKGASLNQGVVFAIKNFDRIADQAALLYRVRDEILSTSETGQRYIDLYYEQSAEIALILDTHTELAEQGLDVVDTFTPGMQALLDGQGDTVVITSEQIQQAQAFLDALIPYASPELQQAIADERDLHPLENMNGATMDQAWVYLQDIPSTEVLDDFNRADGSIGGNWSGNTYSYRISSDQLLVDDNGSNSDVYWSNEAFGPDQEAYITFSQSNTNAWEQDLLLKAQSNSTWGDGILEVLYDTVGQRVQVWTYEWPQEWIQHGADIPVTFIDGDIFGARALADGTVEVYRNEELLASRDITSWSHYADGGYIGLWFIGAENTILDDFGGGAVLSGTEAMSMASGRLESQSAGVSLMPEQLDVKLNNANIFWQGVPLGSDQEASVTFAQITDTLIKPQSNGVWGEGVVEVQYDVPGRRIQVWMFDPQAGWMKYGKNIPVKFANGDTFSVFAHVDGTVEIYRNGNSLAKLDVIP